MTTVLAAFLCLGLCLNQKTYLQTKTLPKPTIWAEPSSVITQGKPVSIWCQGSKEADRYLHAPGVGPTALEKQVSTETQRQSQVPHPAHDPRPCREIPCRYQSQASWSVPSKPLDLVVTGVSRKPSLSVLPGFVVAPRDTVTLQCHSDVAYDRVVLSKDGEQALPQQLGWKPPGLSQAHFLLNTMNGTHGGQYRCYGGHNLSCEWSAPSDPLDILVAALLPQNMSPTLSVQLSPTVALGENVTLRCQTGSLFDAFLLLKKGVVHPPLHIRARSQDGVFQANFPMSSTTLDHGGTYRCYGSLSSVPFLLSYPSNPLELKVEGAPVPITPSVQTPNATRGTQRPDYTVENLIRIGLSALILVVLGVLVYQE